MNMEQLLLAGEEILSQSGIEDSKIDAWYLMEYYFHLNRVSFWVDKNRDITSCEEKEYLSLIERRSSHIPLQYITGEQEFMGLNFKVNEDVLIPRQDTECLVEKVLPFCSGKRVLDLCTGSGCIIVSIAKLSAPLVAVGTDISAKALLMAEKNARLQEVLVSYIQSDLFEKVVGMFDIIVSNPPYIESRTVAKLMPEVREHEPLLALDGREDGLYFYRRIIKEAGNHLSKEGRIFFEIGHNQGNKVKNLLEEAGFEEIEVIKDLCGMDRVVCGKY